MKPYILWNFFPPELKLHYECYEIDITHRNCNSWKWIMRKTCSSWNKWYLTINLNSKKLPLLSYFDNTWALLYAKPLIMFLLIPKLVLVVYFLTYKTMIDDFWNQEYHINNKMKLRLIANAFYRKIRRNKNINHRASENLIRNIYIDIFSANLW